MKVFLSFLRDAFFRYARNSQTVIKGPPVNVFNRGKNAPMGKFPPFYFLSTFDRMETPPGVMKNAHKKAKVLSKAKRKARIIPNIKKGEETVSH